MKRYLLPAAMLLSIMPTFVSADQFALMEGIHTINGSQNTPAYVAFSQVEVSRSEVGTSGMASDFTLRGDRRLEVMSDQRLHFSDSPPMDGSHPEYLIRNDHLWTQNVGGMDADVEISSRHYRKASLTASQVQQILDQRDRRLQK